MGCLVELLGQANSDPAYLDMTNATARYATETDNDHIKNHQNQLAKLARSFAKDGVAFDDLMQIGRLSLHAQIAKWRAESSLWTYAKLSVRRDMMRFKTSEIAAAGEQLTEDDGWASPLKGDQNGRRTTVCVSAAPTPAAALERAQSLAAVNELLTAEEHRVINLRIVEELDVRAVAEEMGISKSEVDRVYHEVVARLQRKLGGLE